VLDLHGAERVSANGLGDIGADAFGFAGFAGMVATTGLDTRPAGGAAAVIRPPSPAEDEGYESEADYYPKATPPTLDTSTRRRDRRLAQLCH
jgi:hypothetical protein